MAPAAADEPGRPRKKRAGAFHHGDLRAAAMAAAVRVVEEQGAEALSIRSLAQGLGVTDPAIYRHFESRDALLLEVARRGLLGLWEALLGAFTDDDDVQLALEAVGRAYLLFAVEHAGWFRLCFSRGLQDAGLYEGPAAEEVSALGQRVEERLKATLGEIVGLDLVDDHFRAFWGLIHGLAGLVIERVFRRVDTDAERVDVALRAVSLHVAAVCDGPSRP